MGITAKINLRKNCHNIIHIMIHFEHFNLEWDHHAEGYLPSADNKHYLLEEVFDAFGRNFLEDSLDASRSYNSKPWIEMTRGEHKTTQSHIRNGSAGFLVDALWKCWRDMHVLLHEDNKETNNLPEE